MINAKKKNLWVKTQSGNTIWVSTLAIGDYAYHKSFENTDHYSITHIPSTLRIHDVSTQKEARRLTYQLSIMKIVWDGKGVPPQEFLQSVRQIIKEPY